VIEKNYNKFLEQKPKKPTIRTSEVFLGFLKIACRLSVRPSVCL